jgi:flagellar M-ring protein FliF
MRRVGSCCAPGEAGRDQEDLTMERLRKALNDTIRYLGALPLPSRLLMLALGLVVVLSLVIVATRSAGSAMVEVMPGMPAEDQARAAQALDRANIAYAVREGRLLVRAEDKHKALGWVLQSGAGPKNTQLLFSNLAASQHWMNSRAINEQQANIALMNELALTVRNFRGVEDARVVIDVPEPIGMGMAFRRPTAAVSVTMAPGRTLTQDMVDSIAALVAGAKAGLDIRNVAVIDTNNPRQRKARSEDDARSGDYMEHVARVEAYTQEKLAQSLAYVRGVIVAVSAQVDLRRIASETEARLPVGQGSVAIRESENTTSRTQSQAVAAAEPGVRANVGADLSSSGAGGGSRVSEETSESRMTVAIGTRRERVVNAGGIPTRVTAMVSLPREYIASLVMQSRGAGNDAEPTQAEIDARFAEEKNRLERELEPLVRTAAVDSGASQQGEGDGASGRSVVVSLIPVAMGPPGVPGAAGVATAGFGGTLAGAAGGGGGGLTDLLSPSTIRTGVVVLLSVAALGMMFMLTRKAARPVELPRPEEVVGVAPTIHTDNDLVGEADESQTAMEGIELDEQEIKTKKMLEQVQEMVRKNPGDAATLLNRWIQTTG